MNKKRSYVPAIVTTAIGLLLCGSIVPLLVWVRSLLKLENTSLLSLFKAVVRKIVDPYPINPDHIGSILVSLLGFIIVIAGVILLLSGISKFFSTAAENNGGRMSYVPGAIMLFCGAAVLLCCLWMVLHMLTAVAQHEHFVHLIIDAILLLAIAAFLIVFGIIKLQRTDKYNKSINLYGMPAAEVNRSLGIRATNLISNIGIHTLLIIMSIVWLIPFACIILQSFRCETAMPVGYVIPKQWGFDNYAALLKTDFPKWYLNTFIMALAVAVLQTIIVLCMSYVLSRFRFKLRKPLMSFMLILGMFPGMLTMIILYRVLKDLGLTQANAVPGLILVYVASSGMGYYVSKGFFDTLPKSLDEAACMDGATRAQVLFKIILPLAKPIVIYTVLTAFMGPWGDFVFARYISMNTSAGMNVAVGLNSWLSLDQINTHYTWFCAGGVIVAIPVTILFLCLQRYYVEGVTGGAVKG